MQSPPISGSGREGIALCIDVRSTMAVKPALSWDGQVRPFGLPGGTLDQFGKCSSDHTSSFLKPAPFDLEGPRRV